MMYFAIIRDSISKLKNLTNVIRSNAIIWKNSVSLIKVMLLFSALLKHFVWYLDGYLARQNTAWLHHENVFHCSTITFSWSDITNISLVWITLNNYVQFVFGNTIDPLSSLIFLPFDKRSPWVHKANTMKSQTHNNGYDILTGLALSDTFTLVPLSPEQKPF